MNNCGINKHHKCDMKILMEGTNPIIGSDPGKGLWGKRLWVEKVKKGKCGFLYHKQLNNAGKPTYKTA